MNWKRARRLDHEATMSARESLPVQTYDPEIREEVQDRIARVNAAVEAKKKEAK